MDPSLNPIDPAAPVVASGPASVARGQSMVWKIEMPAQPADDPPSGYRITLSESASHIDISTAPCAAPATTGCQLWTITPSPAAVPGRYWVGVKSVGTRAPANTQTDSFSFDVLAPAAANLGDAVEVITDGATVLVRTDAGGLFGMGENGAGQLAQGSYPGVEGFDRSLQLESVQPQQVPDFVALPSASGGRAWTHVAISNGSVYAAYLRDPATGDRALLAWGENLQGELGFASAADQFSHQITPTPVPGIAYATSLDTGPFGAVALSWPSRGPFWQVTSIGWQAVGQVSFEAVTFGPYNRQTPTLLQAAGPRLPGAPTLLLQEDGSLLRWVPGSGAAPTPVAGLPGPVRSFSVSGQVGQNSRPFYALALLRSGEVWSWSLARGAQGSDGTPSRIDGLPDAVAVHAGATAWAVRSDGSLWFWTPLLQAVPIAVPGLGHVSHVADGWAITGACPEGRAALWRVDVSGGGATAVRHPAFGGQCDGTVRTRVVVEVQGNGLVSSTPAGLECRAAGVNCAMQVDSRGSLTLRSSPDAGWRLDQVEGDCVRGGSPDQFDMTLLAGGTSLCKVRFVPTAQHRVEVMVTGPGVVRLGTLSCPPNCSLETTTASDVVLTAEPGANAHFVSWSGDCSGSATNFVLAVTGQARCTATFEAVTSASTGNLVLNPGFEQLVAAGGVPSLSGAWQGDATSTVGADAGITPRSGASMLKFIATGPQASATLVSSQMWQIVDLRAWSSAIDAGGVRVDASAWFHRVTGGPNTDRRFDLRLLAFDTTDAGVPQRYQANAALAVGASSVDTTGAAWQQARTQLMLPPLTRVVLAEIYAYEDVLNDAQAPEFDGHYADDVVLTLTLP
ncbi:MAG TPA: hypothetical protein PLA97_17110 [Rubrivivax sp.]|nr:hypothetical protein [Rubrivivax sp.]